MLSWLKTTMKLLEVVGNAFFYGGKLNILQNY